MTMLCFGWSVLCTGVLVSLVVDRGEAYTNGIGCLNPENKPYFVVEYGMYNDEPPNMFNKDWNGNVTSGISKGVYAFDKLTGFWLITSIPKFPPSKSKGYAFNMAAVQDGHMALCLTLNSDRVIDLRTYEFQFVLNISKVKFPDIAVYPSLTRDRAKWAVTKKLGRWICVGDHDRSTSTLSRGGGVLCMVNYTAWKALHNITQSADKC
uniref:Deoxyribonuclease-2-beta n=1 Tax=Magallana gigas TaxID=29159 RepID=K1Q5K9_MAGGI